MFEFNLVAVLDFLTYLITRKPIYLIVVGIGYLISVSFIIVILGGSD